MARKTFTTDYLRNELGLPFDSAHVISDEITDTGRWNIVHDLIFEDPADGKCYQVGYSVGATENQDERPWEYEDTVTATEVEKRKVLREEYVDVDSPEQDLDQMIARAAAYVYSCSSGVLSQSQEECYSILARFFTGETDHAREASGNHAIDPHAYMTRSEFLGETDAYTPPAENTVAVSNTQPVSSPAFQKFFEKLKKRLDDIFYLGEETTILDLPDEPSYTDSFAIHCTDGTDLYYQLSSLYEQYQQGKENGWGKPLKRIVAGIEADYDHHDIEREYDDPEYEE